MVMIAELIGVCLVGYGIWFMSRGVKNHLGIDKDWWRPLGHQKRYPYPVAGILLGVCFVLLGLRFALNTTWGYANILGYAGGALFVVVLVIGVAQPRFFHPQWYSQLEARLGKKGMLRLRHAAFQVEADEWLEVVASEVSFNEWVDKVMPAQRLQQSRGYARRDNGRDR
jgi:hypothetical protein